jgi:hypothetical protein
VKRKNIGHWPCSLSKARLQFTELILSLCQCKIARENRGEHTAHNFTLARCFAVPYSQKSLANCRVFFVGACSFSTEHIPITMLAIATIKKAFAFALVLSQTVAPTQVGLRQTNSRELTFVCPVVPYTMKCYLQNVATLEAKALTPGVVLPYTVPTNAKYSIYCEPTPLLDPAFKLRFTWANKNRTEATAPLYMNGDDPVKKIINSVPELGVCGVVSIPVNIKIQDALDEVICINLDFLLKPVCPTKAPTKAPIAPTKAPVPPTKSPTFAPTKAPVKPPTKAPAKAPTKAPTKAPSASPTLPPVTKNPTKAPILLPAPTSPSSCIVEYACAQCGQILECYINADEGSAGYTATKTFLASNNFCSTSSKTTQCGSQQCSMQQGLKVYPAATTLIGDKTCPVSGFQCRGGAANGGPANIASWVTYSYDTCSKSLVCPDKCSSKVCDCTGAARK